MTALILTLTLIGWVCYALSIWVSPWLGLAWLAWIAFGVFWFFRTWMVKGKNGPETLFDKIAMSGVTPVVVVFGPLNYFLQETLRLP